MSLSTIQSLIRDVPDFPKPGILFKDLCPVFQDPAGLKATVDLFIERWQGSGVERLIAIESRGFLFGAPVAYGLGIGCGLVRKAGKLPYETRSRSYALEYGEATVEAHIDMVVPGQKVAVVDDLLATGGTARAAIELVQELGAEVVEAGFLCELSFLPGREVLASMGVEVFAPIAF